MIRHYSKTLGALAAASALVVGYASAELEGEVHVGYSSDYMFRGSDQGNGLAEAGADVSTQYAGLTLSGGLWYGSIENSDLLQGPGFAVPDHYSELDLYGEVSKDFGFLTAYVGYVWYHFEQQDVVIPGATFKLRDDAQELYFGLSREICCGINGALTYYWSVEGGNRAGTGDNGGYLELALDKTFKLHECVDLVAGLKTGYFIEEGGFAHVTPQVSVNVKVKDNVTISPYVAYSIEGSELASVYGNNKIQNLLGVQPSETNHFFGGVKLAVKF